MFALLIATTNALNRRPTNSDNKPLAKWCARQREKYKKDELLQTRVTELRKVLYWEFDLKSASADGSSVSSSENTIVETTPSIRKKQKEPISDKGTTIEQLRARRKSDLEKLHQRYKSMNSATLAAHFAANPQEFHDYHTVAEKRDALDLPERKVMTRLAAECAKLPPKCSVADLGCGKNQLRTFVPQCKWTSVDAVAIDDTVQVADLAALPFDDCHFQAAVLSRALWGRDHQKQLAEAFRILNYGAPLIVCESWGRWRNEDGSNQLIDELKSAGFTIKHEPNEKSDEPFQYIIAQKPALL
jgi:SAM-dependent methyltransferase